MLRLDCIKASGLNDRKRHCIDLILCLLRSFNRESFHASPIDAFIVARFLKLSSRFLRWLRELRGF